MHTFGFPVRIDEIVEICSQWKIPVVEDAAESLGSEFNGKPTGSFGEVGVFSFNGNKIVTCGGGWAGNIYYGLTHQKTQATINLILLLHLILKANL